MSNECLDTQERLNAAEPSSGQLAHALLNEALEQRSLMRKRLSLHQELHRMPAGRRM